MRTKPFSSALLATKTRHDNETELQSLARDLSSVVTDHTNDILVEQYQSSKDLRCMEVTTADQYQTRKRVFFVRSGKKPPSNVSHRRPLFARSRVVTVQEIDSGLNGPQLIVSCSCGRFFHHMCACSHEYCILDRQPNVDDVFPEKCKSYEVKYHRDEDFRRQSDHRTQLLEQSRGIVLMGKLEDIILNPT